METAGTTNITVEVRVKAPISKVWQFWTQPEHIVKWNNASDDWHTPWAKNDLRTKGKFVYRMEAKDGSTGFDLEGVYDTIKFNELIEYTLADGRKVSITFTGKQDEIIISETFEAENMNPIEMQRDGWQAILNNFKKCVEAASQFEKIHFEKSIDTKVEIVFEKMFDKKIWKEWTAEFNPTSSYKGTWQQGSKILFLGTDPDGNQGGMVSRIKEYIPNKFVSIEHLGILQGEQEIMSGPEVEGWAGALENYTFSEVENKTLLSVDMDANEEFKAYFNETWPKALNKLKEICES